MDNYLLYSFDIFDTIVKRRCATSYGIFLIIQYKLINEKEYNFVDEMLKQNFAKIRFETAIKLKKLYDRILTCKEILITDIYNEIGNNYNLSETEVETLLQLEIETEKKNLLPIPENINKIKQLAAEKKQVILISDMYLSESILREILSEFDNIFENIPIYVSCDLNKSKENKELYKHIKNIFNIEYQNWIHCGDNYLTDIKNAQTLGIKTKIYQQNAILQQNQINTFEYQAYLGSSKLLNMQTKTDMYRFAIEFSAPILYSYVNWIINTSVKKNIEELYFITRDGYILKEIADIIIEQKHINIKTNLFYGSRISLRIPTEENINSFISFAFDEYRNSFNFDKLAQKLYIEKNEILKYLNIISIKEKYTKEEIEQYKNIAVNSEELKQYVLKSNKERLNILIKYLRQELNFHSDFAFVDLSGSGKSQDMLENIIQSFNNYKIQTFYFHTNGLPNAKKYVYLPIAKGCMLWLELLCRCPFGQTLGYKNLENSSKIIPILEEINTESLLNWGYKEYFQGIKDFSSVMANFEVKNNINIYSPSIFYNYNEILLLGNNRQWARILGSVPAFKTDGKEEGVTEEIAPPYSFLDVMFNNLKDELSFIRKARTHKNYFKIKKLIEKYWRIT